MFFNYKLYLPLTNSLLLVGSLTLLHDSILAKHDHFPLSVDTAFVRLSLNKGVSQMPHARIINTEFKSKEDLEIAINAWKKWSPDNMPDSLSRYIVQTGEKSTMMTTVYENEELLSQAQVIAAEWWKLYGHHVYETIVFDGRVID